MASPLAGIQQNAGYGLEVFDTNPRDETGLRTGSGVGRDLAGSIVPKAAYGMSPLAEIQADRRTPSRNVSAADNSARFAGFSSQMNGVNMNPAGPAGAAAPDSAPTAAPNPAPELNPALAPNSFGKIDWNGGTPDTGFKVVSGTGYPVQNSPWYKIGPDGKYVIDYNYIGFGEGR